MEFIFKTILGGFTVTEKKTRVTMSFTQKTTHTQAIIMLRDHINAIELISTLNSAL